jgi:mevalonate kinase
MEGWLGPTLGIFLVSQLGAAVWWAGTTQERVDQNTAIIEQVVDNEKDIAVVKVQQIEVVKDVTEIKEMMQENQKLLRKLLSNISYSE